MSGKAYWSKMREILDEIEETEWPTIQRAAQLIADTTVKGDMVHIFGPGHTHTLVDELWLRAGGLASINPILDAGMMPAFGPLKGSALENLEGYGRVLLETHSTKPGEPIIIISNVGRLPVVVDMGLAAKEAGLTVITLTSLNFSRSVSPTHSSGKKLYEIAEIVIDNKCPPGEAALKVEGFEWRIGPATMIANAWILNAMIAEVVAIIQDRRIEPPVFVNFNLDVPDDVKFSVFNELTDRYRKRLTVMDFRRP